jgi:hypothetical protein
MAIPTIYVCPCCNKPLACSVQNDCVFCVNCLNTGKCYAGNMLSDGLWQGRVVKEVSHYECTRRVEQCLDNALFVAT